MFKGNGQSQKKKYNCKYFLNSTCKNGQNCKFLHPVSTGDKMPAHLPPGANTNSNDNFQRQQNESSEAAKLEKKLYQSNYDKKLRIKNEKDRNPTQSNTKMEEYYSSMLETAKKNCLSCNKKQKIVYLSCGCSSLCSECAKNQQKCGIQGHKYDKDIFIF